MRRKKYAIEKRDGEKIISRRKGFTVDTCTSGIAANQESPSFQGASTSEKVCRGRVLLLLIYSIIATI